MIGEVEKDLWGLVFKIVTKRLVTRTKARRGTGKRKGLCALISIDILSALNTASWNICIEAMVRKKVPDYLLRMIDDYLSDR